MKKLAYKFVLLGLIIIVIFMGIAQANAAEDSTFRVSLTGATAGGGGVWDMIGAGLAEAIMRSNKGSVVTVIPGNAVSDIIVVSVGKSELGLSYNNLSKDAQKGNAPFKQKYENFSGVMYLYEDKFHFVVHKDGRIKSIASIIENKIPIRINVGDPGSSNELLATRLFKAYGVSLEDIESWGGKVYHNETFDGDSMFADGIVEAFIITTCAPVADILELATTAKDLQILPVDDKIVEYMVNEYGYSPGVILQSTYDFLNADVNVLCAADLLIANNDVSEEVMYNITRSLVENLDYIRSININLSGLTPEGVAKNSGINLHPGAEKYYKEIGSIR